MITPEQHVFLLERKIERMHREIEEVMDSRDRLQQEIERLRGCANERQGSCRGYKTPEAAEAAKDAGGENKEASDG